jgi:uncharacterized phiE125 gp8 family phage protein
MAHRIIIAAAAEPVSLAEARLHLRLTADDTTAEDSLIMAWIAGAREFAEDEIGQALAPQTLEAAFDWFPEVIALPMPPVSSIVSIKYTDTAGVEQTLAADQYALSLYGDSRLITPAYGATWPSTQAVADAVKVRYVTGYANCPKAAKAALLLIVANLYEHRGEAIVDSRIAAAQVPLGALVLLSTIKRRGF